MSKKISKRAQNEKISSPKRRKAIVITGIIVSLLVASVALGHVFETKQKRNKGQQTAVETTASLYDPGSPSKEYIYAGGRLVATEEDPNGPPSGNPPGGDFDGDGLADITYYRHGLWGILRSDSNYTTALWFSWGGVGLIPMLADFDGDRKADLAYIVPPAGGQSQAYAILKSSTNYDYNQPLFVPAGWPSLGDTPIAADFDGDGKAEPAIWRSSDGIWIIPTSSSNYSSYIFANWGVSGDVPIAADFDSDHKADIGFYRNGLWGVLMSSQSYSLSSAQFFSWGASGLSPIVAEFDGDEKADLAYIVPPSGGQSAAYAILKSSTSYNVNQPLFVPAGWQQPGDAPIVSDFDGDGKVDPGNWQSSGGIWSIPKSTTNYVSYLFSAWGQVGDIPMPNKTNQY